MVHLGNIYHPICLVFSCFGSYGVYIYQRFFWIRCYMEKTIIKLELEAQEVNAILQVLGELPTKSGAFPLVIKVKEQADAQMPKEHLALE
mgnify:CR=1 FL=1